MARRRAAAAAAAAARGATAAAAARALPLLLLAAATATVTLAQGQQQQAPAASNPYAGVNWSGCEHGFCPPLDLALEQKFYSAAAAGDMALLKSLLRDHTAPAKGRADGRAALNLTRNIVPDDNGHARVLDVAVWAAVRTGKADAVRLLFQSLDDAKQPEEEGHLVELAADNGDLTMLELLLDAEDHTSKPRFSKGGLDMPTGPSALAHAALKANVPAMRLLLDRDTERVKREVKVGGRVTRPPLDLKAGMGAASRSGSVDAIRAMVEAGGMAAVHHPISGKRSVHDWQGEFVEEALGAAAGESRMQWRRALVPLSAPNAGAVAAATRKEASGGGGGAAPSGSLEVALRLLLEGGNYTVPWAKAQALVAAAARSGHPGALAAIFEQPTVGDDADELAEAAQRALGVAAEEGKTSVVEWLLQNHAPAASKACGTALRRAIMYDHLEAARVVLTAGKGACADAKNTAAAARLGSYQDAGWIGAVLGAARRGSNDVLEALLASKPVEKAAKLLGALHTVRSAGDDPEDEEAGATGGNAGDKTKKPPPPAPRPDRDPLAAAAARGDLRAVRALLPVSSGLCASCAAVEAARAGHLELLELLIKGEPEKEDKKKTARRGPAISALEEESTGGATDGLRCLAQALDQGQWAAIEWLSREHQKGKHLLAYFLPAVAQHADEGNMRSLLEILERAILEEDENEKGGDKDAAAADGDGDGDGGGGKSNKKKRRAPRLRPNLDPAEVSYVRDQIHSATVSAALKGTPDVLSVLQGSRLGKALWSEEKRQWARQKRYEEEAARMREAEAEYMEKRRREEEEEKKKKEEL